MIEQQNIEYKSTWKDEYLKWICGFANANGGTLYIGKDNNGNVIGVKQAKKLLENLPNKITSILGIVVDVNLQETTQGDLIEIIVEPQPTPVNYKGEYHYRSGSVKHELKGAALDKFLLQKYGKKWDGVPVPNIPISELKHETLELFKEKGIESKRLNEKSRKDTPEQLLDNLKLIDNGYLKRAALLLFHPDPEKFVTGAYIKIGFFSSESDLLFQDDIHGNLFEQVEKTMELLLSKYTKALISYKGLSRIETYEYPQDALREALLNAVSHKDYSGCTPIQIRVYNDKIKIWNDGQLPENWTVKNLLREHSSRPYNPDIANAFFRSGYVESWGRGIAKIESQCANVGLPTPTFINDGSDFWVIFKKNTNDKEYINTLGLNERQKDALVYFREKGEIISSEYAKKYNITERTARNDLKDLAKKKLLKKHNNNKLSKYIF
ncbi:MAG: putative DNA binding domain-containing protein [Planctomycetaceae bacterium]|jgi:ATP-dependent DNA helicase RecG|nr:putative DNA binding domain-containing protein [Planctomycetaceae bacterium]